MHEFISRKKFDVYSTQRWYWVPTVCTNRSDGKFIYYLQYCLSQVNCDYCHFKQFFIYIVITRLLEKDNSGQIYLYISFLYKHCRWVFFHYIFFFKYLQYQLCIDPTGLLAESDHLDTINMQTLSHVHLQLYQVQMMGIKFTNFSGDRN